MQESPCRTCPGCRSFHDLSSEDTICGRCGETVPAWVPKELRKKTVKCYGQGRHWFVPYGDVGNVQPFCVRCGEPNPSWERYVKDHPYAAKLLEERREWAAARIEKIAGYRLTTGRI